MNPAFIFPRPVQDPMEVLAVSSDEEDDGISGKKIELDPALQDELIQALENLRLSLGSF